MHLSLRDLLKFSLFSTSLQKKRNFLLKSKGGLNSGMCWFDPFQGSHSVRISENFFLSCEKSPPLAGLLNARSLYRDRNRTVTFPNWPTRALGDIGADGVLAGLGGYSRLDAWPGLVSEGALSEVSTFKGHTEPVASPLDNSAGTPSVFHL